MIKYRFEIIYQTKKMKEVSDFMSKLDLGFDEIGMQETWVFECSKENEVALMKEKIVWAIEECEGTVLHIEGGKVE